MNLDEVTALDNPSITIGAGVTFSELFNELKD